VDYEQRVVVQIWDRYGFTYYLSNASTPPELKGAVDSACKHVALLVQRGEARIFIPAGAGTAPARGRAGA
jgi:hypothetical protein